MHYQNIFHGEIDETDTVNLTKPKKFDLGLHKSEL